MRTQLTEKIKAGVKGFAKYAQSTHQAQVDLSCMSAYSLLVQNHHDALVKKPLEIIVLDLLAHKILPKEDTAKFEEFLNKVAKGFIRWEALNKKSPIITYPDGKGKLKNLKLTQEMALTTIITAIKAEKPFEKSQCPFSTRLENFYNNILSIQTETNCPTGVRNELIKPLHKLYDGIFILTEWESSLVESSQQFYESKLFEQDEQTQFKILCQMMTDQEESELKNFFGDGEDLKDNIIDVLERAIGKEQTKIVMDKIDSHVEARAFLPYPCPDSLTTQIQLLEELITAKKLPNSIQKPFNKCRTLADLGKYNLSDRMRLDRVYKKAKSYQNFLPLGKAEGELQAYAKTIVEEIAAISTDTIGNEELSEKAQAYESTLDEYINQAKSEFSPFIRDGFAMLQSLDKKERFYAEDHRKLFTKLINDFTTQKIAIDNDKGLLKWYSQFVEVKEETQVTEMDEEGIKIDTTQTNTVTMTPMALNRLILQALTTSPDTWSKYFTYLLTTTVIPLIEKANEGDAYHEQVIASSYPSILIGQLKWLTRIHKNHEPLTLEPTFCAYHLTVLQKMMASPEKMQDHLKELHQENPLISEVGEGEFFGQLDHLTLKDQVEFDFLSPIIRGMDDFLFTLNLLPEESRLHFAIKNLDKVSYLHDLYSILDILPELKRLDFFSRFQDKIKNGSGLVTVLKMLPEEDRLDFATKNLDKIIGGTNFAEALKTLPVEKRLNFATKHKIKDCYDLTVVLCVIPEEKRADFASRHQDKIKDCTNLGWVLKILPEGKCLEFATKNLNKIKHGYNLANVLMTLPEEKCLDFTTKSLDKIKNGSGLAHVLKTLPNEKCLEFATKHQDKIKNSAGLTSVLKAIPKNLRLAFAEANVTKIKLIDIGHLIPQPNYHNAIESIYKDILKHLDKKVQAPRSTEKLYAICQHYQQKKMTDQNAVIAMIQVIDDELPDNCGAVKQTSWAAGRLFSGCKLGSDQTETLKRYKAYLADSKVYLNSKFSDYHPKKHF